MDGMQVELWDEPADNLSGWDGAQEDKLEIAEEWVGNERGEGAGCLLGDSQKHRLAGGEADWVVFLERNGECWPAHSVGRQVTGWIVGAYFESPVDAGGRWQ